MSVTAVKAGKLTIVAFAAIGFLLSDSSFTEVFEKGLVETPWLGAVLVVSEALYAGGLLAVLVTVGKKLKLKELAVGFAFVATILLLLWQLPKNFGNTTGNLMSLVLLGLCWWTVTSNQTIKEYKAAYAGALEKAGKNPWFWVGFIANFVGAIGTTVLGIVIVVRLLPMSSWPVALFGFSDLASTLVLRAPVVKILRRSN